MSSQLLRMFAFVLVLCVTLESATVGAATINEPPGDSEIEQIIAERLPGYWGLHSNTFTGPVDYGNAIEPDWRWRFETVITPKEPLFVQGGKRDNVVLLQPTLYPGSQETLYGIARATFHAGSWSIEIGHENKPFESRGLPASFFPGRTVAIGSPEEQTELEETQKRALEALQARHEAEVLALKNKQETALAGLKIEHEKAIAEIAETNRTTLAALELELRAKAEKHRIEIEQTETLMELAATATQKLATLHEKEKGMLAATKQLFDARQAALDELVTKLDESANVESYETLLKTVAETESDWLLEAVMRRGLDSDDQAIREVVWIHLIRTDLGGAYGLRPILAEHVADLSDNSRLRTFLRNRLSGTSENPHLLKFLAKELISSLSGNLDKNTLPSISQWERDRLH